MLSNTHHGKHSSPVRLTAMEDASNLDTVHIGAHEKEPVVADAKPELFSSLKSFYLAGSRFREALQGGEDAHGRVPIQATDVRLRRFGPNDPPHLCCLNRSISSCLI